MEYPNEFSVPAGGFGCGHLTFTPEGEFRHWRLHPGEPELDVPVPANRFHLFVRRGAIQETRTLCTVPGSPYAWDSGISEIPSVRRMFPLTYLDFSDADLPLHLSARAFSPVMPGCAREASLPVYVVLWRAYNPSDDPIEVALMLTWACGWPKLQSDVVFDLQHDNLCITGALGRADSANRIGIAVPDLHHAGIYQQGLEPWDAAGDGAELWSEFAANGELEPAVARAGSLGAAAWVKFQLEPGEEQEIPFVMVWHFPVYESGPLAGKPRYYTQFLEKFRPDNAVVWLAEQVVQNFGLETANYRYWLQQIHDWHHALRVGTSEEAQDRLNALSALLLADTAWAADGEFRVLPTLRMSLVNLRANMSRALPIQDLWPEIAAGIPGIP